MSANFQKKINKTGQDYLSEIKSALRLEWARACKYDAIPLDTKFAIFSDENPHTETHRKLMSLYQRELADYQAGGYVGLQIVNGKARL